MSVKRPLRSKVSGKSLPKSLKRVLWDVDMKRLDADRDADVIIARVVEFGVLEEVRWLLDRYGRERIHRFFREVGRPEISDRTVAFWRAVFKAPDEKWPRPPAWRRHSSAPWVR